jgi:hypothetical protein
VVFFENRRFLVTRRRIGCPNRKKNNHSKSFYIFVLLSGYPLKDIVDCNQVKSQKSWKSQI